MAAKTNAYYPRIIEASVVQDFVIEVKFTDGTWRRIDLEERIKSKGGVFVPLHDAAYFARMRPTDETVEWQNGADIAPETLYGLGDVIEDPGSVQSAQ